MSSSAFAEVLAFEGVYGPVWLPQRLDYAIARQMAWAYNLRRRKGSKRLEAKDLLPVWPKATKPRPSVLELQAKLLAFASRQNAR